MRPILLPLLILFPLLSASARGGSSPPLILGKGDRIALIGGGLASRMAKFSHFETETYLRHPNLKLVLRNMGDEGNTPAFRPQPGRDYEDQFAFPGARELLPRDLQRDSEPEGHRKTPDEWLADLEADVIIAFFGYNSSFEGPAGLERFKAELGAFLDHTLTQKYNGKSAPRIVLVSPTAFEDLSDRQDTPNGVRENANLSLYTEAMRTVAQRKGVPFVDLFAPTLELFAGPEAHTLDGALLNDHGHRALAPVLADRLFGKSKVDDSLRTAVHAAVEEKNWMWLQEFKIPNGVHVYGRRYKPFGPENYPHELKKVREMTGLRDRAIWAALAGRKFRLAEADRTTHPLPEIKTNYRRSKKTGSPDYRPGEKVERKIKTAKGYEIELFASEAEFPHLANPVQLSFDGKGRLWVAVMPSYPHWRPGDPRPADKLLILEDTDGDGKADRETVFAGDLHLPLGFEIAAEGVYVSQADSLVLLKDTDGDDRYDERVVLMSGFDDHDTHHAISAFCADPSGAILMGEGVFLHTNVETAYGPVRGTNGGFYRYAPRQHKLIRYSQCRIPNPWGIAIDDYGQEFFLHTSGSSVSWMLPSTVKPRYGVSMRAPDILTSNSVRPTSGIEIISSRHFPDEVQGDLLLLNTIGFRGAKQHRIVEDGTGFTTRFRQDLFESADSNFRPVDLEFAPDGSLYVCDWHNALIGHMQHNARDPNRDHAHGRIYRVTYPSRPLVQPARIHDATIDELLGNLTLPESRTRYRTRRELRGRPTDEVLARLGAWAEFQTSEHALLEALWVSWGHSRISEGLVRLLLKSKDHRIRSAVVHAIRFNTDRLANHADLLMQAARDPHGRVRLEAITAASWLPPNVGLPILDAAAEAGTDSYSRESLKFARSVLAGSEIPEEAPEISAPRHLTRSERKSYLRGHEIYGREGYCGTCHREGGEGLPDAGFPPLAGTKWVNGDEERLIKLTLHGLMGPIEVKGRSYPGTVPMTPFAGLLNDEEIADVLTYVRNSFGNQARAITPEEVQNVREASEHEGFYTPAELLDAHPHRN